MVEISIEEFFNKVLEFDYVPFAQSPAWIKSRISQGKSYRFFVDDVDNTQSVLAGERHSKPLIGELLLIEGGPVVKSPIQFQSLTRFLNDVTKQFDYVELNSSILASADFEVEVRRAGFKRALWARTCPLTIDVDLHHLKLKKDWKYRRNKANKSDLLDSRLIEKPSADDIGKFLGAFTEMKEAKSIGFVPSFDEVNTLLQDPSVKLFFIEDQIGLVAARIIWVHKERAFDIYAANTNRARNCSASHKLLLEIFESLKALEVKLFDFGRVGPCQGDLDSVFVFKRGSGGQVISYNGEWVKSRSTIKEFVLAAYVALVLKKRRW